MSAKGEHVERRRIGEFTLTPRPWPMVWCPIRKTHIIDNTGPPTIDLHVEGLTLLDVEAAVRWGDDHRTTCEVRAGAGMPLLLSVQEAPRRIWAHPELDRLLAKG